MNSARDTTATITSISRHFRRYFHGHFTIASHYFAAGRYRRRLMAFILYAAPTLAAIIFISPMAAIAMPPLIYIWEAFDSRHIDAG